MQYITHPRSKTHIATKTRVVVSEELLREAQNIVEGVYAPLRGFLRSHELHSILNTMRLPDGSLWPMPIVLDVDKEVYDTLLPGSTITLADYTGHEHFALEDIELYEWNRRQAGTCIFGTSDPKHPGNEKIAAMHDFLIGGTISPFNPLSKPLDVYRTPLEMREFFRSHEWNTVVAFQTRNAPHRSHEHLQKTSLSRVDGLLVQPLIGAKKHGDFSNEHVLGSYEVLFEKYYPKGRATLGTLHTYMRYAGPKEALFHALVRRNFGCTHMIIGRDHAGVGDYYGTYDAQKFMEQFSREELGIEVIPCNHAFHCHACGTVVFEDECPHDDTQRVIISGTEVRNMLSAGKPLPREFMREEVIEYLLSHRDSLFVE